MQHHPELELGQRWTHKLTKQSFLVAVVEGEEVLLEPEGDGMELTISPTMLYQEFRCSMGRGRSNRRKPQRQGKFNRRNGRSR